MIIPSVRKSTYRTLGDYREMLAYIGNQQTNLFSLSLFSCKGKQELFCTVSRLLNPSVSPGKLSILPLVQQQHLRDTANIIRISEHVPGNNLSTNMLIFGTRADYVCCLPISKTFNLSFQMGISPFSRAVASGRIFKVKSTNTPTPHLLRNIFC